MPIKETLRNGDICEVLTRKDQTPKADWLNICVTSKARTKIRAYLREEQMKQARMGREELERKIKNWKLSTTIDEAVAYLGKYFKIRRGTEVYMMIATQKIEISQVKDILSRWLSGEEAEQRRAAAAEAEERRAQSNAARAVERSSDALIIDDRIGSIEYKLAKCCNPIKGDDIFGFVTISSGITIHRSDCPNASRLKERYPYRVMPARWRDEASGSFRVTIAVTAQDTPGLANTITEVVSRDLKLNIRTMSFSSRSDGSASGSITVEVPGTGIVDMLLHAVRRIKGVRNAYRVN